MRSLRAGSTVEASPRKGDALDTYVILRRSGWKDAAELGDAAGRSRAEGERMSDDVA